MRVSARVKWIAAGAVVVVLGVAGGVAVASVDPRTSAAAEAPSGSAPSGSAPSGPGGSLFGPDFYGVNYDVQMGDQFHGDANVDSQIAALHPGTIRWPGGTGADFYDWHTGTTTPPNRYPFTLEQLYDAWVASGPPGARAVPVFDLNVLSSANRMDPDDQINMLKAAQSMGLPIIYVELGNELYFPGPSCKFQAGFASGKDYGNTVAVYVRALHNAFPGDAQHPRVQVAADGALHPGGSTQGSCTGEADRKRNWNSEMLTAATGAGSPDAVILHDYPGPTYPNLTAGDLPTLFDGPYTAVSDITTAASALQGKPIWFTEYNLDPHLKGTKNGAPAAKNPVQLTYAHELFLAELGLMLPRAEHIAFADNFGAFAETGILGDWANPAKPALTPAGQAVKLTAAAGQGAISSSPIAVDTQWKLANGQPAVIGQAFVTTSGARRAVLVNLTTHRVTIPTSRDLPAGTSYYWATGNPVAAQATAGNLTPGTIATTGLTLEPYSVTLVGTTP